MEPSKNELVGYCPKCGVATYSGDFIRFESSSDRTGSEKTAVYKCIRCKKESQDDELIPF